MHGFCVCDGGGTVFRQLRQEPRNPGWKSTGVWGSHYTEWEASRLEEVVGFPVARVHLKSGVIVAHCVPL